MLNNCKDKGRKGLHFSQQKGKIRKNSRVGIFIEQHLGITRTDVGQYGLDSLTKKGILFRTLWGTYQFSDTFMPCWINKLRRTER
jgi:hypothetical protein